MVTERMNNMSKIDNIKKVIIPLWEKATKEIEIGEDGKINITESTHLRKEGNIIIWSLIYKHKTFEFESFAEAEKFLSERGYQKSWVQYKRVEYTNPIIQQHYNEMLQRRKEKEQATKELIQTVQQYIAENFQMKYIRFGKIPENGQSYNFRDQFYEKGVSAFRAWQIDKDHVVVDVVGGYFTFAGYLDKKQAFFVTGEEIVESGSDGEPLLKNASIIKKCKNSKIYDIRSLISEIMYEEE